MKNIAKSCLGVSAVAAAAIAPVSLSAQLDLERSPVPRYHLVQLSVSSQTVAPDEFKAKTQELRSCSEATDLAKNIGADVKRNRHINSASLPDALQEILKDLPAGHATPVFSNDGSTLRVLVLCNLT